MVIPSELDNFFRFNDPDYQKGYSDGFEDAMIEVVADLEKLLNKVKRLEAMRTGSSTITVTYSMKSV